MQPAWKAGAPDSNGCSLYYISEDIRSQGEKGEAGEEFLDEIGLVNLRSGEVFLDKVRMLFVKLPLLHQKAEECVTPASLKKR